MRKVGLPLVSLVLVCLYPCAFLYFRNADEARAADMVPFLLVFLITAAAALLFFCAILRNVARGAFLADLSMLAVEHFTLMTNGLKDLIPGFRSMILLVLILAALGALTVLLFRKKPDMTVPCGLLALAFGVMVLVSAIPAVPTLIAQASYEKGQAGEDLSQVQFQSEERPNVYYMIFDEYGGPINLGHFFDYDNSAFFGGLEDRGFAVSGTSKNTISAWTVTLVPNMLNLQYVTSDEDEINNRTEWMQEPEIYRLFRANGYAINLVNQNSFMDERGCKPLTFRQVWETISFYLYENSIFRQIPALGPFLEEHVLHRAHQPVEAMEEVRQAMIDCYAAVEDQPTLTICYVEAPHAPFYFRRDGSYTRPREYYDWRQPELYLAKLEYITPAILETVDNIQKNDPEAVIILQADHGARLPGQLVYYFGGPWFDTDAEIPYMENILNAVYVPGGAPEIEGVGAINTVRMTIDQVFGTDLGTIPQPPDYTIPAEYMPPPPDASEG